MQFFESKKAMLEYCGKDGKDVRWLDRAIKDGKVGICEGDYYLVTEYVKHLEEEVNELEEKIAELRKQTANESVDVKPSANSNEVKELRRHLCCLWEIYKAKDACLDKMAESFYEKREEKFNSREEGKVAFYKAVGYVGDPREGEELAWAVDNKIIS